MTSKGIDLLILLEYENIEPNYYCAIALSITIKHLNSKILYKLIDFESET